jgi:hypothetical protein
LLFSRRAEDSDALIPFPELITVKGSESLNSLRLRHSIATSARLEKLRASLGRVRSISGQAGGSGKIGGKGAAFSSKDESGAGFERVADDS